MQGINISLSHAICLDSIGIPAFKRESRQGQPIFRKLRMEGISILFFV